MINCSNVRIDNIYLHVELKDGRMLSTPLDWYPVLTTASETECRNYTLIARGTMIEWPDLDLHLDVEEMFNVEIGDRPRFFRVPEQNLRVSVAKTRLPT